MTVASIPRGTRDFGPDIVRKRNYIIQTIRSTFETYGFEPLETPAMENIETLTGKYGDEGDKLMFKILNNGDIYSKGAQATTNQELINAVSEKALRYDLTIPFARYVAMNRSQLTFPFKRFQIQPVWRADNPQRGRFREFYQCDADVIGSKSLISEMELLSIYSRVFEQLNLQVEIKLNNRKILAGLAELAGIADRMMEMTILLDKLDKIGPEKLHELMLKAAFSNDAIACIEQFLAIKGTNETVLLALKELFKHTEIALRGIDEIETVLKGYQLMQQGDKPNQLAIDLTLARGLNYYTGIIIEVKSAEVAMGSIGGGGRYDDLTGIFGVPDMSGVGISFGLDRIYEVLLELNRFPDTTKNGTKVLFINFGNQAETTALQLVQAIRQETIAAEIYPSNEKIKKQMEYANKKQIPFVVLIGENELQNNQVVIKNMASGEQQTVSIATFIQHIKELFSI